MKNVLDGEAFAGTLLLSAGSRGIISQNVWYMRGEKSLPVII